MDSINNLLTFLDKIQGWPAALLTVVGCISIGYLLKFWKWFPNESIPIVVILFGIAFFMFLADPRPSDKPARIWVVRNAIIGLIYGCVAWALHYWAISYAEEYLIKKFGKPSNENQDNTPNTIPPKS